MYFIHYFYVTVTDAAPKCPRAESPASSWPCAELSRRRVGGAELAAPNRRRRVVPFRLRLVTGAPLVVGGPRQFYFILNQRGEALT